MRRRLDLANVVTLARGMVSLFETAVEPRELDLETLGKVHEMELSEVELSEIERAVAERWSKP